MNLFGKRKYKMQDLYDVLNIYELEIKEINKIKEDSKREMRIDLMKSKIWDFFQRLGDIGIDVILEKEDGIGKIRKKDVKRMELTKLYKDYIKKTVDEIDKEIARREKLGIK